MNLQTLEQELSITFLSYLNVKGQIEKRLESSILLGQDKLWSSDTMYRHLATLEMLVPISVTLSFYSGTIRLNNVSKREARGLG